MKDKNNKVCNIVLITTSIILLLISTSFFFNNFLLFMDGIQIFYVIMLLYFGCEFTNYLLTKEKTGMNSLYISLACIIASVSGLINIELSSNYVIGYTLLGWLIIMLVIKLIRIEELRYKNTYAIFVNVFSMSLFILLGFIITTNIFIGKSNQALILGFFFTVNAILNLLENISLIKLENIKIK